MISKLRTGWSGDWTKPFGGFYKMKPGYLTLNEGAGPVNFTYQRFDSGDWFVYLYAFGYRYSKLIKRSIT